MSSSSTTSKLEKEKLKLIQEKCQGLLNEMLRDEDNKYCVDCDAKGPRWASWNLGIFLCIRCAGIHRNLGVHISRVKSVNLDTWTPEQVVTMQQMGNSRARAVYEANMPDNFRRPQTDVALENFIRAKYEHKKYIAQEWVKPTIPKVNWDSEIEESLRKKKEAKKQILSDIGPLPSAIPKPKPIISSSAAAAKISNSATVAQPLQTSSSVLNSNSTIEVNGKPKNPSDDLLGLMTNEDSISNVGSLVPDPFASPVKSAPASNSTADDLGSIFTSPDAGNDINSKKMTKESILSLYGQGQGSGNSVNPFASQQMYPSPHSVTSSQGNPFPQYPPHLNPNLVSQGGVNPYMNLSNNMSNTTNTGIKDAGINSLFNFQTEVAQIQQQMHGMNVSPFNNISTSSLSGVGNNPVANFSQVGQAGIPSFLGQTGNQAPFPSQIGQTKNPGPFF